MNNYLILIFKVFNHQKVRYLINGTLATIIHYSCLFFFVEILEIYSVGISNFFASIVGIIFSFLGNRYYVFNSINSSILIQLKSFLPLYYFLSVLQGIILYFWTDIYQYNYNFGFSFCILIQVSIGYFGGKYFVFKEK